jgi:hypothetical protein
MSIIAHEEYTMKTPHTSTHELASEATAGTAALAGATIILGAVAWGAYHMARGVIESPAPAVWEGVAVGVAVVMGVVAIAMTALTAVSAVAMVTLWVGTRR